MTQEELEIMGSISESLIKIAKSMDTQTKLLIALTFTANGQPAKDANGKLNPRYLRVLAHEN